MKVYVDEMPKNCHACQHCYHEIKNTYCCVIQNKYMEFFGSDYHKRNKDCPLQSLSDHDKQVRKEVVQEIRKYGAINYPYNPVTDSPSAIFMIALENLERIEQGE